MLSTTESGTSWKKLALPMCKILGVLFAFAIVCVWFPSTEAMWNLPLQQIDAPAHYYFVRKLLSQGISAAAHLWPNDAYYPPAFHMMAAGLIKFLGLFGIQMNIYTSFNLVWIFTSGLVWPAGMQLLSSRWTSKVDSCEKGVRTFSCSMAILIPVISVISVSHPYWMLSSGPLIAFGLATSLLPFWIYSTLGLLDSISSRKHLLTWILTTLLCAIACIFAHPRITFTWILFIFPFLVVRLPWKLILASISAIIIGALAHSSYT